MYRLVHAGRGLRAELAGGRMFWLMSAGARYTVRNRPLAWTPTPCTRGQHGRSKGMRRDFRTVPANGWPPGRYKVTCSLVGSFGDAQRQGAGIGALTSGPALGGRTKVA